MNNVFVSVVSFNLHAKIQKNRDNRGVFRNNKQNLTLRERLTDAKVRLFPHISLKND